MSLVCNSRLIGQMIKNEDMDWSNLNTGYEGTGKSTFGIIQCRMVDPDFNVDNIAFTQEDFFEVISDAPKGSAVFVDEGVSVLFSRNAMKTANKDIVEIFAIIRKRNLFFNMNFPNIMLADKYIREHRINSRSFIVRRGWFKWYIPRRTQDGELKWSPYPDVEGRFPKLKGKLWDDYEKKKNAYIKEKIREKKKVVDDAVDDDGWLTVKKFAKKKRLTIQGIHHRIKTNKFNPKDVKFERNKYLIREEAL